MQRQGHKKKRPPKGDRMVKSPHVGANCDLDCAPSPGRIDRDLSEPIGVVGQGYEERTHRLAAAGQKLEIPKKKATTEVTAFTINLE